MALSWLKIKNYRLKTRKEQTKELPAVSFIIPAFNEESLIVETIQTYFSLPQQVKEIIVINDGSHDHTMNLLMNMYQLQKVDEEKPLYQSITHPELKVFGAPHLGKSQALNFGIEIAQYDIICTMDADTIPIGRGVDACLSAFALDPKLIACGGVIQVLSNQVLKDNSPLASRSKEWITSFQRIEYLRTFICERLGWSLLDSTVLISGAFCMVKKEALLKIGGFSTKSITEDFDLIVRLRKAYRGDRNHFQILPVTTCYTQVPRSMHHLAGQRIRWKMGLVQTLFENSSLFMHPGYGMLGIFAIPYFWLGEMLSPIVELLTFIVVPYSIYQGWIGWEPFAFFFILGIFFNVFITMMGIYFDNHYVSKGKPWAAMPAFFDSILINFGYKQINTWWRLKALMKCLGKRKEWGAKPREEIIHHL